MKITPLTGPGISQLPNASANSSEARRAAAIAKLEAAPAPQAAAPIAPNMVSPEEASAVKSALQSGQTSINEAKLSEPTTEAPKSASEEQLSSHYANLARKEKAQRARDAQLKAREDALRLKEESFNAPKTESIDTSKYIQKDRLTSNPLEVLSELGLSYEQITELAMNAPKQEDLQRKQFEASIDERFNKLIEEQEKTKKFFEEQQTQSYQQALKQIKSEVTSLVKDNPEYEMISLRNATDDVVELIERTFKEDGNLLSVDEASKLIEDDLVEEALTAARAKKIQQRLTPAQAAEVKQAVDKQAPTLKTLTNSNSSSRPLSAKERAIMAFKGEKL